MATTMVRIDVDTIVDAYETIRFAPDVLDFDEDGRRCCPLIALYYAANTWARPAADVFPDDDEREAIAVDARRHALEAYAEEYVFGFLAGWENPDVDRDHGAEDPFHAGAFDGRCAARECSRIFERKWW